MFPDPNIVVLNGGNLPLIRINQDGYSSEYLKKEADGEWRLKIRNSSYTDKVRGKKVERHNAEFTHTVYPVAPAVQPTVRKVYTVFEMDTGDDAAFMSLVVEALGLFLNDVNALKMLNYES